MMKLLYNVEIISLARDIQRHHSKWYIVAFLCLLLLSFVENVLTFFAMIFAFPSSWQGTIAQIPRDKYFRLPRFTDEMCQGFLNFGKPGDITERMTEVIRDADEIEGLCGICRRWQINVHQLSKADGELIRRVIKEYGLPLADMACFLGKDPKTVKDFWGLGKASKGAACRPAEHPIADDVPRDQNPAGGETRPRAGPRRRACLPEQRRPRQPCSEAAFVMGQELRLARAEAQNVIDGVYTARLTPDFGTLLNSRVAFLSTYFAMRRLRAWTTTVGKNSSVRNTPSGRLHRSVYSVVSFRPG
jgi:hypothetical protein